MRPLAVLCLFVAPVCVFAADPPPAAVLDLWPGKAPGETADIGPEQMQKNKAGDTVQRLEKVSKPQITVHLPAKDKATGAMVLVAPGGGYNILAIGHEGAEVARWLNDIGVAAAVLKYRVPRRPGQEPANLAQLQDAQRAMGMIRSRAGEWGVDPKRVGMLGFSAGGHLTATTCIHSGKRLYDPVDDADKEPTRPDFAVLIYPGGLVERGGDTLRPEITVDKTFPPAFFVHASDDSSENSVALYRALKQAGVPAEMHLYAGGGHGFGLRPVKGPTSDWPKRCEEWLSARRVLKR